jgi:hypothetical protein
MVIFLKIKLINVRVREGRGECTLILFYIFFLIQEKRRENLYMHIKFS